MVVVMVVLGGCCGPARGKGGGVESATLAGGSLERPRQWRGAQWPRPLPLGVLRRPEPSGAP